MKFKLHRNVKNIIGMRSGKLVASKPTDKRKYGSVVWECNCDCGNISYVKSTDIILQRILSCGCSLKKPLSKLAKDLTGQKFGKLFVLEATNKRRGSNVVWRCLCDCGNEHFVGTHHLTNKSSRSCGCYRKEKMQLPFGESALRGIFQKYKRNARNRNLNFSLSKEEFKLLTQQNCYYCNAKPSNEYQSIGTNGSYIYNGIDRIDNSKGYTLDNCVPCCKMCNIAKHATKVEDFLSWIEKVYLHSMRIEYT